MSPEETKIVHLFHGPAYREYQRSFIQAISLPIGARGQFHYGKEWVNDSLIEEMNRINESDNYFGLIWALSRTEQPGGGGLACSFACPVRSVEGLKVTDDADNYYITFRVGKFLNRFKRYDREGLASFTGIAFDNARFPLPGSKKGFVHIGPQLSVETIEDYSFADLFQILKDIPSGTIRNVKEPEIKSYPLVKLGDVVGEKANKAGFYELKADKRYRIPCTFEQDADYRSRDVIINKTHYSGRRNKGDIYTRIREEQTQIEIEVEFNDVRVIIPLQIEAKKPWYKKRLLPIFVILVLSIIALLIFPGFMSTTQNDPKIALIAALVVMNLDKIFETLRKP